MNWRNLYTLPVIISVGLHLMLVLAVTVGWESTIDPKPRVFKPNVVQAKLVELKAKDTAEPAQKKSNVIDLTKKRELEQQKAAAAKKARRSEERREGKSVDLGGRRMIKKERNKT